MCKYYHLHVWTPPPETVTELILSESLATAVNVTVLSAVSFCDVSHVSVVASAENEVITRSTSSVFTISTDLLCELVLPVGSVTVRLEYQ